jgi:hypothetical protein
MAEETIEVEITCYTVLLGKFTAAHFGKEFGGPFFNGTTRSSKVSVKFQI